MRVKRKRVGYSVYLDFKTNELKKNVIFENKLEDSDLLMLLKNKKFYYSLFFPSFFTLFIYISHTKPQITFFSILFGVSLLPLLKTILEVFSIFDYHGNKDMA